MNIVQEKRQEIIKENNTAQSYIESFLSTLENKSITKLVINEKISGEVDLSILKSSGFLTVREIVFQQPGEITSVINFPTNLEVFKCNSQLLRELNFNSSLRNLTELECKDNYLQTIDLKNTPNLEKLDLTNNKLETLENLPTKTLVSLILDGNEIKNIDLANMDKLQKFHINDNKTVVIQNLPKNVNDFSSHNNPFIEVHRDGDEAGDGNSSAKKMRESSNKKVAFIEALNDYFKMKNRYELYVKTEKKRIYLKYKIEKNVKIAKKMASSISLKCINCKQEGGTVFQHKDNIYTAFCGNKSSPCNLKIEIHPGIHYNNESILEEDLNNLITLKKKIIYKKLEISHKYKHPREITQDYKTMMNDYHFYKEQVDKYLKLHEDSYYSDERKEKIAKKNTMIFEIINEINVLIEEYKKNGNSQLLKAAIDMQIQQLLPEIKNLRGLKHEIMEMNSTRATDTNKKKKTEDWDVDISDDEDEIKFKVHTLFQKPISLHKMESNIGDDIHVAKYIK